jgi:hypothetical protein
MAASTGKDKKPLEIIWNNYNGWEKRINRAIILREDDIRN